jgi:hypothetical protein
MAHFTNRFQARYSEKNPICCEGFSGSPKQDRVTRAERSTSYLNETEKTGDIVKGTLVLI